MMYPIQVFSPDGRVVHAMIVGSFATIPAVGDVLLAGDGSALVVERIQLDGATRNIYTRANA